MKPGKGSFDSNTVHSCAWCMCMRMVQLRAQGLCAFVWINYVRMVWDQSGLQLLTWMVRIHLCTSCLIRSIGEDRGLLILRILYETSGYVAKRLCSGLLTRQMQVQVLSCPLVFINALVMQRQHTGLPNLVCGFDSRSGLSFGRIAEFVWFLHSR